MAIKINKSICINALFDLDDFAFQFVNNSEYDDAEYLILAIDEQIQDWDFTEKMYHHFKKLHDEFEKFDNDPDYVGEE